MFSTRKRNPACHWRARYATVNCPTRWLDCEPSGANLAVVSSHENCVWFQALYNSNRNSSRLFSEPIRQVYVGRQDDVGPKETLEAALLDSQRVGSGLDRSEVVEADFICLRIVPRAGGRVDQG